jgi:hypothetical protein
MKSPHCPKGQWLTLISEAEEYNHLAMPYAVSPLGSMRFWPSLPGQGGRLRAALRTAQRLVHPHCEAFAGMRAPEPIKIEHTTCD